MRVHRIIVVLILGVASLPRGAVLAAPVSCAEAYEKSQEQRTHGHLGTALVYLRQCLDLSCPKFMREDCSRWFDQTEVALPSVVFAVRRDGKDQSDVEVMCDGTPLARSLDGKAIAVDPGLHTFSFQSPGLAPFEQRVMVREGERNRIIEVALPSPVAAPPETDTGLAIPTEETAANASSGAGSASGTLWMYSLAGIGALGIVNFGIFGLLGKSQRDDLQRTCAPDCQPNQVDSVKTKYIVADVSLGVGVLSAGIATYLYVASRRDPSDGAGRAHASSFHITPKASGNGGVLQLSTAF
jgi:hypothetical protein